MTSWLEEHLDQCGMTREHQTYLLGRGARPTTLTDLKVCTWEPLAQKSPDPEFCHQFGNLGSKLEGHIITPFWAPSGRVIGFESRALPKKIYKYMCPEAQWNPHFVGLSPAKMARIWAGADVWVVEGAYDMYALEQLDPEPVVLGTLTAKLSSGHLAFLSRYMRGIVNLTYDNDTPGRNGLHGWVDESGKKHWGAVQKLTQAQIKHRVISYTGKDPGVVWDTGGKQSIHSQFGMFW